MPTLSLDSVQTCIMAAYQNYLNNVTGNFYVQTTSGQVGITCETVGTQFNCGFPGFNMASGDKNGLRAWCTNHPGPDPESQQNWSFGFRDTDGNHPDSVNIILINRTQLMFNFHVYLV
jgi:hypothetical protein